MFPLRDHNPTELVPVFTLAIMTATVGAWWFTQGAGASEGVLAVSVCRFGVVPGEVTGQVVSAPGSFCHQPGLGPMALLTSMFMHGSWGHLIGNMWFLWVFGNNVEDSMGHLRFLVFYLLVGVGAAAAQIAMEPASAVPMVGASGAISGIMGAYLLLYPRARVDAWLGFWILPVPAWVRLGYWTLLQVTGVLGSEPGGGVAFGAHVGGFIAGLALTPLFRNARLVNAKRQGIVLTRAELDHRGWW